MNEAARRPLAEIDLAALRHNAARARDHAGDRRIFAAVKADGYGHGMTAVATALGKRVDGFMVATPGEGEALRRAGLTNRILVLQGFADRSEARRCARAMLEPVIHDPSQLAVLAEGHTGLPIRPWLKLDSGMHRLGLLPAQLPAAIEALSDCRWARGPFGLMTHFARADEMASAATLDQLAVFEAARAGAGDRIGATSLANSAALIGWPQVGGDWVRPGIMLYGGNPFVTGSATEHGLRPVMRLTTRLVAIKQLAAGEPIGYGGTWRCPEAMPVGVAAIGYGDGYPRHAPSGTPLAVNGQPATLVGRVSMDLITIDLRGVDAKVGDVVELWGEQVCADEVARACGTISYELFCAVAGRVRREYRHADEDCASSLPNSTNPL